MLTYLQNLPLQPNTDAHNYETQTQHRIYQPKSNHQYAKDCIKDSIFQRLLITCLTLH